MYGQNVEFQSGQGNEKKIDVSALAQSGDFFSSLAHLPDSLKPHKDINGRPLVKYTDNSSILTQQGFQRLRDRFKLLNSTRKILKGERTQYCFFNRVDKNDGVGVLFNKHRNKANYSNIMRCANAWGCPVCAAIISEHRKTEVKEAMDWWKGQGGSVLL